MPRWTLAFNTNGFAHHRLHDAIVVLARAGYKGVALTPDVHHLDVHAPDHQAAREKFAVRLAALGLGVTIETGARYQLDPFRKHFPSLLCGRWEASRRIDYLLRCIELAVALGSNCVSLWSGHDFEGVGRKEGFRRLTEGLKPVMDAAAEQGVVVAFEPEPGMFIETVDGYREVAAAVPGLRLALDIGHLMVTGEREIPAALREFKDELATVAIEDMKRGRHEHLPFGEGDIDFAPVLAALDEIAFDGFLAVELSRAGREAPRQARAAVEFLARFDESSRPGR